MALKPYRNYGCGAGNTTINYMMNEVAEQGIMVVRCPGSTGSGLPGDPDNLACVPTTSGSPLGVLLQNVEDVDETRFPHLASIHSDTTTLCRPVEIVRKGEVHTNMIATGITPSPGDPAYYTTGGLFTTSAAGSVQVGTFEGSVGSDGYVVVRVDV